MKTFKSAVKLFSLVGALLQAILKHGLKSFIAIVAFDAISASGKIISVLVVALAVKMLSLEAGASTTIYGYQLTASDPMIVILGVILGFVLISGAACAFASSWLSRKLGRKINEQSMSDIYKIFQTDPGLAAWAHYQTPVNPNVLLTQVPIHVGLAVETIARLVNPLVLLIFAGLSLLYQQPLFTISVLIAGLIFVPFIIRFSLGVQSNAQSFYSNKAAEFGQLVNSKASMMMNQHSIIKKDAESIHSLEQASSFFSSFDKNHLANERASLLISFVDGFLRAFVFIVLCLLVLRHEFSAESAVLFLGGLAYALTSARHVAALTTNLLRYFPQAIIYFQVIKTFSSMTKSFEIAEFPASYFVEGRDGESNEPVTKEFNKGQIILMFSPEAITTLSLGRYAKAIFGSKFDQLPLPGAIVLANGAFRFGPVSVMGQLLGEHGNISENEKVFELSRQLGADADFANLEKGYDTLLTESVWRRLGAEARVALRLIPLALSREQPITLLDIDVIRAIGAKATPFLRTHFSDRFLFVVVSNDQKFVDLNPDLCMQIDPGDATRFGDQAWLKSVIAERARDVLSNGGTINIETLI